MSTFDPQDFTPWPKGNQFEDFTEGQVLEHHWGRTINAGDNSLFSAAMLHFNPLYFNAAYAEELGHPSEVVNPMLVLCTAVGMSVQDLSEAGGPFLGVNDCQFHQPVYPGDTISCRSTVLSKRESASRPREGIVTWETEVFNQRDELVLSYMRTNLSAKRGGALMTLKEWGQPAPTRYLTPERMELQASAHDFAMDVVLPMANELDKVKGEFPDWFLEDLAKRGYFGIMTPTEYGGMGLGVFEYCLISEEIARAWMSAASIIARANGMGVGVEDPERRAELSRRQCRGEWIGAAALSEPNSGSDLASVATRAVDEGDHWALYGEKRWCGNALRADFIQVLCRTRDPEAGESRSRGLSTLLVEKERGSFPPGLTGVLIDKIGYHGFLTWNLTFDGVKVPKDNVLGGRSGGEPPKEKVGGYTMAGGEGRAFKAVEQGLNVARVHTASRAVGLARAAVEDCIAYTQERVQFEHPISDFQAIRFKIAEMAAQVEMCRAFYHQVAQMIDDGEPCEREAAMCKLVATEMAVRVTGDGIQVHGGNGYTTERAVERHWRDARLTTIFEGTSQIQMKIISDRLLPRSPLG